MAQRLSRFVMFVTSMAVLLPGVVNAQPMPSQAIRPDPYSTDPKHWHNVQYRVQELAKKLATARCLTPELTKEQGELSETLDAWAKAITIMMKASAPLDSGFSDAYMKASDTMIFEINPAMRRLSSACAKPQQTGHQPSTTAPSPNQPVVDQSSIPAGSCEVNGLKMECGAEPPPPLPHQDLFLRLHELEAKVAVTRCRNAELSLELKQAKRAILDIWDDLEGSKAKRPAGSGAYGVYYQLVGLWYAISNQLNALPETCPSPSAKIAEAKSPQDGIGEKPNFDDAPTIVEQPNLSPGGLIRKEAKAQTPRDECQSESSQPCTSEGTEKTKTEQPPQKKVEESSSGAHGGTVGAMPAVDPLIQPVYDMINRDRADVGLGPLERDPALEKGAQQHTYEMKDSDDLHHATREGRGDERENIGKGLPNETPLQVAERWSAEKKKFRKGMYPDVCYDYSGPLEWYQCAHYTMMIWAVTTKFGCAWARGVLGYLWVDCRFSPGGNKDNRPVGPVGSDLAGIFKSFLDQHPDILAADRDAYFKVLQPGYGNTKLVRMTDRQLPKPARSSEQRPLDVMANVRVDQAWASRQIADAIDAMTRRSQDSPLRITVKSSYAYSSDRPVMTEDFLSPLDQMILQDMTASLMARLDEALRTPAPQSAPASAAERLGYVIDALTPLVLSGDIREVDVDTGLEPPELAPADDLLPPTPTPIEPM